MDTREGGDFEGMQYLRQSQAQQMQDQTKTFDAKKWVWIPDPEKGGKEGFIAAQVKSTQGEKCEAETQDGKVITGKDFNSVVLNVESCFLVRVFKYNDRINYSPTKSIQFFRLLL